LILQHDIGKQTLLQELKRLNNGHVLPDTTKHEKADVVSTQYPALKNQYLLFHIKKSVVTGMGFFQWYNPHVLADTTNIENAIMPPPRGAMGPARNRRRPNWPVPIAPRGGSAEGARKFYFLIKATQKLSLRGKVLNKRLNDSRKLIITMLVLPLLFIMILAGCENKGTDRPIEKVPVQLKWQHSAQFAGFYIAEQKGYYAAENIAVTLKSRPPQLSNEKMVADLTSENNFFTIMGGEFLLAARKKGAPIKAIAVVFQRNPYVYATLKNSKINRPQDFIGKKLMLPPDGEIQHAALMKKLGIPWDEIEYIPYDREGNFLKSGQIDVQMVYRPGSGLGLEEQGLELKFIWLDDYDIRPYADTIVTTEKMIQERPVLVEGFLRASLKGWRYAIENPEEAVSVILSYNSTLSREQQMRMMQIQTPLIHTGGHQLGWMEPAIWQDMQALFHKTNDKLIVNPVYTMEFLHRIYGH